MTLRDIWSDLFEGYFKKSKAKKQYKSLVTLKKITKLKNLTKINKEVN